MPSDDRIFCECGGLLQGMIAPDMKICGTAGREIAKESSVELTPKQLAKSLPLTECSSKRVVRRVPTATSEALFDDMKVEITRRLAAGPASNIERLQLEDMKSILTEASFRARVRALLRRIEWSGGDGPPCCPSCEAMEPPKMELAEHHNDCELAAMIRETEG